MFFSNMIAVREGKASFLLLYMPPWLFLQINFFEWHSHKNIVEMILFFLLLFTFSIY